MTQPLSGLRFLDLTRLLPGPAATMHLADFGAEVIKIEDTGEGDYMRGMPPRVADADGESVNPVFAAVNRGKRSMRVDLKTAGGRDVLLRLVDTADALIEQFRPGVMDRLGLGWDVLHARNPRLVLSSLTGYGQNGPLSQAAGHDLNYCALAGVLDQNRASSTGAPAIPNLQIGDLLGGTLASLSALLIAVIGAQRTGHGSRIDVAMTDALLVHHFMPHAVLDGGDTPVPSQTLLTGGVPCYRIYETRDGRHLALGALELKFWQAFCEGAGLSDLAKRHWALGETPGSQAAHDTIERVAARLRERTLGEWLEALAKVDTCVAPVLTPVEALQHPQALARELVHRRGGVTHVGRLARFDDAAWTPPATASSGAHTFELLRELGYKEKAIEELRATGSVRGESS